MFGVSPAFVLSGSGRGFSLENYCQSLPRIRRLGFDAFSAGDLHGRGRARMAAGGGAACSGSPPTSD